jgi:hypothetical protein
MISSQQGQSGLFMLLRYNSTSLTSLTSSFETSVTISQSTRPYITENFYLYPAVRISSFACILSLTAHPITYIIFHRINHIIYLRQRQPPGCQRKISSSCPHHHYPTPHHHLLPPSLKPSEQTVSARRTPFRRITSCHRQSSCILTTN